MSVIVINEWVTEVGYNAATVLTKFDSYGDRYYCGYVEVPKDHVLYKAYYTDKMPSDIDPETSMICEYFSVHGEITYDGSMGNPGTWWFGFDCNHLDDNICSCDEAYVKRECESLARQLKDLELKIKHKDGTTLTLADEALILLKELQEE